MRAYGVDRHPEQEWPDVADIQKFAMKSSAGRIFKENGEYKSYIRGSHARKTARRFWKKRARRSAMVEIFNYLRGLD